MIFMNDDFLMHEGLVMTIIAAPLSLPGCDDVVPVIKIIPGCRLARGRLRLSGTHVGMSADVSHSALLIPQGDGQGCVRVSGVRPDD